MHLESNLYVITFLNFLQTNIEFTEHSCQLYKYEKLTNFASECHIFLLQVNYFKYVCRNVEVLERFSMLYRFLNCAL